MPFLGSLLQARRNPLGFARHLIDTYGDLAYFKIGFYSGYLVNHPNHCQHVLITNNHNYNKANYNYRKLKPVLGDGLITASGDRWLHHRRLIQPIFHRGRIASVGNITTKATNEMLTNWTQFANRGQPVDLDRELMRLTLKVVAKFLFSVDAGPLATTIRKAFTTLNEDIAHRFRNVFIPPLWIPTSRNRRFAEARAELDRHVYRMIEGRREGNESRHDLLDTLLVAQRESQSHEELSDRHIRDEVMTLLLAGHETTANLLAWTSYLVSRHSRVEQRLIDELDAVLQGRDPGVDDLPELEYMKMVLQESLRLYPPVWIISRKAISSDMINGYRIPAGATVTICFYTLHRHPAFWHNPDEFDPERFSADHTTTRHQGAYLPFGGGPRSCIGQHLAMIEAQLILAMIYQRYQLEAVSDQPTEPEPLITLRPRSGLSMFLTPRSS